MDIIFIIDGNTLYLDIGYLLPGDCRKMINEINSYINYLKPPFNLIFDFERAVKKHCLIHPDDVQFMNSITTYFDSIGRKISIFIIPEHSILLKNLKDVVHPGKSVKIVESIGEAKNFLNNKL